MKNIKKLTCLIIFFVCIYCESEDVCRNNEIYKYITDINFEDYYNGNYYESSSYKIIIQANDNKFYYLPIYYLYPINKSDKYNEYSFKNFVCGVLNNDILINVDDLKDIENIYRLEINEELQKEIEEQGLFSVINKYNIKKQKSGIYNVKKNTLSDTFLYAFLKQGYLFEFNDFDEFITVFKPEKILTSQSIE